MTVEPAAIAIAPHGTTAAMSALIDRLRAGGMKVTVTDELGAAALLSLQSREAPPCILLDLDGANDEIEDRRVAADTIHRVTAAIPHTFPIAIAGRADAAMIVACMRAGAGEVLDIALEGTANAPALISRVWQRQCEAALAAAHVDQLRAMVEELLKDLIRTERRALATEEQLAPIARDPAVLIVESEREVADRLAERLEEAGVTSYAYVTGEDAVRQATRLEVDLAVVAAQLPTIDGLETVRQLREHASNLPAYLLGAPADPDLASRCRRARGRRIRPETAERPRRRGPSGCRARPGQSGTRPRAPLSRANQGAPRAGSREVPIVASGAHKKPMISRIGNGRLDAQHQASLRLVAAASDHLSAATSAAAAMFLRASTQPPLGTVGQASISTLPSATVIELTGSISEHVTDPQRGTGVVLKLEPLPTKTVWLIESALAAENKVRAATQPGAARAATSSGTDDESPGDSSSAISEGENLAAAEQELIGALEAEAESLRKLNPFLVLGVGYESDR